MQASAAAGLCFLAIALWVDARAARGILPGNGTLAAVASGAILLALAGALVQVRPFPASPEQAVLVRAADWYAHSDYRLRPVLGSHIRFQFLAGLDPYDELRYRPVTPANLGAAPRGAIVVWDSHYSHRLVWNTPLTLLQDTLRFRELRSWKDGGFSLHIFEKLAD